MYELSAKNDRLTPVIRIAVPAVLPVHVVVNIQRSFIFPEQFFFSASHIEESADHKESRYGFHNAVDHKHHRTDFPVRINTGHDNKIRRRIKETASD